MANTFPAGHPAGQMPVPEDVTGDIVPSTSRIEAFSDGVFAIALTILVLELRVPELGHRVADTDIARALSILAPKLAAYLLSFLLIAIYWVNHHHLFHLMDKANSKILWANNNLLLWISLLSFPTALLGEHPGSSLVAALYGSVSFMAALAFYLLHRVAFTDRLFGGRYSAAAHRQDARANVLTLALYLLFIGTSFAHPTLAEVGYAMLALMYFIPRVKARQG